MPGNQFSLVEKRERLKHAFVVLTARIAGSCFVPTRCETNRGTSSSGTESSSTSRTENGRRRTSGAVRRTWQKRRGLATQAVGLGILITTSGIGRRNATAFWVLIHGMVCPERKNSSSEFIPTINGRSGSLPRGPRITSQTKK